MLYSYSGGVISLLLILILLMVIVIETLASFGVFGTGVLRTVVDTAIGTIGSVVLVALILVDSRLRGRSKHRDENADKKDDH